MEYLTYDEYKEIGGVLESAAFNRYSVRAFARITQETQGRIENMKNIPTEVKHLCRDLIEYLHNNVNTDRTVISASQSQGGSSESESYADKSIGNIDEEIGNLFYDYLAKITNDEGVYLLYRGCAGC